ncbi:MAG: hypothetical protein HY909_03175 [Deltaproteobacteria bacterium]|nr:hypothetical protein [Deltaproteobacteria bacterium]
MRPGSFLALALLGHACGATLTRPPASEGPSWLSSPALDEPTRASLRRFQAYGVPLPFEVTLARPLSPVDRARLAASGVALDGDGVAVRATACPRDVHALIAVGAVRLSCARFSGTPPPEGWRARVNAQAAWEFAQGGCWILGQAEFGAALTPEARASLDALGVHAAHGGGGATSVLVPREALPALLALPFVLRFDVEPPSEPNAPATRR